MRIFIAVLVIFGAASAAFAQCTNEMEAFNNHQNVIKGMMDMNFQGKLNSENSKAIGERLNEGQEASNSGDYAKACEIYDSIIEDYGMEKAFGVQDGGTGGGQEKEKPVDPASESSSSATAEEDASASPKAE